jgi:hypothetical protein
MTIQNQLTHFIRSAFHVDGSSSLNPILRQMNLNNLSLQKIQFDFILITMLGSPKLLLFLDNHTKAFMHLLLPILHYIYYDKFCILEGLLNLNGFNERLININTTHATYPTYSIHLHMTTT